VIGIRRFGESAPGAALMEYFGFTAANVVKSVERVLRVVSGEGTRG
jgi:transketolase